jgi:predicted O-methyltransferase YrrM
MLMQYLRIWKDVLLLLKRDTSRPFGELMLHARCGSVKPTDALILARLLKKYRPNAMLEVGSFLGISTRFILDVSSPWGAKVVAIDPNIPHRIFDSPREYVVRLNAKNIPQRLEIITAFFGNPDGKMDSRYTEVQVVDSVLGHTFDFVFIDGDHSYEAVMLNFKLAIKILNKGGVIVFHDALSWEGVEKALNEIDIEYLGKAKVKVYGIFHRKLLKLIGRANDGIGVFELYN